MKATHIHIPTGKRCSLMTETAFTYVLNLGDAPNPFPRVDKSEVRPMSAEELQQAEYDAAFPDGMPPDSDPGLGMAESFDADVRGMFNALKVLTTAPAILAFLQANDPKALKQAADAVEQFEPWLDHNDDPRSMGWVDDRGRP